MTDDRLKTRTSLEEALDNANAEIERQKAFSRTWERRTKDNRRQVEELQAEVSRLKAELEREREWRRDERQVGAKSKERTR